MYTGIPYAKLLMNCIQVLALFSNSVSIKSTDWRAGLYTYSMDNFCSFHKKQLYWKYITNSVMTQDHMRLYFHRRYATSCKTKKSKSLQGKTELSISKLQHCNFFYRWYTYIFKQVTPIKLCISKHKRWVLFALCENRLQFISYKFSFR